VIELRNHKRTQLLSQVTVLLPFIKHLHPCKDDVGEHSHTSVELSRPPTPPALDIYTDLACEPVGCHVDLLPQPPSPHFVDPLDYTVLCFFILDSTLIVNKDQVVDRVSVVQLTCVIIHDECVWESQ